MTLTSRASGARSRDATSRRRRASDLRRKLSLDELPDLHLNVLNYSYDRMYL